MAPTGAVKIPVAESPLEAMFALQLRTSPIARRFTFVRQHKPFEHRRFRLDFAVPELWFAVECDGAVHRIKERVAAGTERGALLLLAGWKVLHLDGKSVRDMRGIRWTEDMLVRLGGVE